MNEVHTYHLLTTADGQTVPAKVAPGHTLTLLTNGKSSTTQRVAVTDAEFQDLQRQALTSTLHYDKVSGKVMLTPKSQTNQRVG